MQCSVHNRHSFHACSVNERTWNHPSSIRLVDIINFNKTQETMKRRVKAECSGPFENWMTWFLHHPGSWVRISRGDEERPLGQGLGSWECAVHKNPGQRDQPHAASDIIQGRLGSRTSGGWLSQGAHQSYLSSRGFCCQ